MAEAIAKQRNTISAILKSRKINHYGKDSPYNFSFIHSIIVSICTAYSGATDTGQCDWLVEQQ
jgi:hypothetical protein